MSENKAEQRGPWISYECENTSPAGGRSTVLHCRRSPDWDGIPVADKVLVYAHLLRTMWWDLGTLNHADEGLPVPVGELIRQVWRYDAGEEACCPCCGGTEQCCDVRGEVCADCDTPVPCDPR